MRLVVSRELYNNDTVYRTIGSDNRNGILACGFLHKKSPQQSDRNIVFQHYGALLLLDGGGTHVDCDGKEYELTPGCFVQRMPGKPHSTLVNPDGRWLEFFICVGRDLFEALVAIGVLDRSHDVLYPGMSVALLNTFTQFLAEMKRAHDEELPVLLAEAQKIILTIYRMHILNSTTDGKADWVKQACQLLQADPVKRIAPRDVAAHLGIGYEKFRKAFKAYTGMAPGEYAIRERINAACSLLLEYNSVSETARKLGFTDSFSFSKQFKTVTGLSPSQYIKMH